MERSGAAQDKEKLTAQSERVSHTRCHRSLERAEIAEIIIHFVIFSGSMPTGLLMRWQYMPFDND